VLKRLQSLLHAARHDGAVGTRLALGWHSLLPRPCLASPGMASIDTTVTSTPRLKLDEDALLRYLRAVGTERNSPHRFDVTKRCPVLSSIYFE